MNKQTIIEIANKARESYGHQDGYMIVYRGQVASWSQDLMSADSFPFDAFAVDMAGNVWMNRREIMHRKPVAMWSLLREDVA